MGSNLKITREGNDHSFTLASNGYRIVVTEKDDALPKGYPYCYKFGIISFDSKGNYAKMGIGKVKRNEATSFLDGIEKEMVSLQEEKDRIRNEIKELKRKINAIDDFLEALPQIFINDGIRDDRKNT